MSGLWIFANVGIAVGYYVLALSLYHLLEQFMRVNLATKAGAAVFFATCSLTHFEHAYHIYTYPGETLKSALLADHSVVIHTVQLAAVWTFLFGVLAALRVGRTLDRKTANALKAAIDARVEDK